MIKAMLKAVDYVKTRKSDILALMDSKWGIKDPDVRDGIYRDIIGLYSHNGIASDETMRNVIQLVRDTRKSKEDVPLSNVVDWSFAKKAQDELKLR